MLRHEFTGTARKAVLTAPINNSAHTVTADDLTGWPSGTSFPFYATVNRDTTTEEKILVEGRVGNVLTVTSVSSRSAVEGRGWDGTTARSHSINDTLEHTITAELVGVLDRMATVANGQNGAVFYFDGTSLQYIAPSASAYDVLTMQPGSVPPVNWVSKLIPVQNTPPTEHDGLLWMDTGTNRLMVGNGGQWRPAGLFPTVVASTAARDSLFGASGAEPPGQLVWVTGDQRWYHGTGTGWQPMPKPGEWLIHVADAAARNALFPSPADGTMVYLTSTHQQQLYRNGVWLAQGYNHTVTVLGAAAPTGAIAGDLWFEATA